MARFVIGSKKAKCPMTLFGRKHKKWVRYGPKRLRQYRCTNCGAVKFRKPMFHTHSLKLDRRRKPPVYECKTCPYEKPVPAKGKK